MMVLRAVLLNFNFHRQKSLGFFLQCFKGAVKGSSNALGAYMWHSHNEIGNSLNADFWLLNLIMDAYLDFICIKKHKNAFQSKDNLPLSDRKSNTYNLTLE